MSRVPCELVPVHGTVQSRKSPQGAVVAVLGARPSDSNAGGKKLYPSRMRNNDENEPMGLKISKSCISLNTNVEEMRAV